MRVFRCDNCTQLLFFKNSLCLNCSSPLGFTPSDLELHALVGEKADAALAGVEVHDQTITVSSSGVPATFVFIGQDGVVHKTADQVMHASYELQPADTYIRTVIRTANMVMYLNPIIRFDGASLPAPAATVNESMTWVWRAIVAAGCVVVLMRLWRRRTVVHTAQRVPAERETA